MKKNNKLKKIKGTNKYGEYKKWFIFLVLTVFFLNIGYAASISSTNITGNVSGVVYGSLYIDEVSMTDSNYTSSLAVPSYEDTDLTNSIRFQSNNYAYITYSVTIANGSSSIQKYTGTQFNVDTATSNIINYEVTGGLAQNSYLFPGQSTTFTLTYKYRSTAVAGDYNLIMNFLFSDSGKFYAVSNTTTANLVSNTLAPISITVMNNNSSAVSYSLSLDSDKFLLADSSGNTLNALSIPANTQQTITVYLKKNSSVIYYKTHYTVDLSLTANGNVIDFGNIAVTTAITPGYEDTTPPQIGAVSLNINNTVGIYDVTWSRTDTTGSPVTNYYVKIYNTSGTLIASGETGNSDTTYRFTNQSPGTYYAIVYGIDEAENSGASYCSSATTSTTNCRKSANTEIRWVRTVTYTLTNMSYSGPKTVNLGATLSTTLTASSGYSLPSSITVSMNGNTLSSGYTYNSSTGAVTVSNVTGDIVITASGTSSSCLVQGTKILMADGTYKNVEDIRYDSLLTVYNHETGEFGYEYPAWIEQEHISNTYQLTTFSDGTSLKTVGSHTVFSVDENRFISVDNYDHFKIGTNILKVKKVNGKNVFYNVSVTNIEIINKTVKYYDVVTTRYFNLVSDNVLTSDGREALPNMYEFDKNLVWTSRRQEVINNNIQIPYSQMTYFPYYLYYGLRAMDAAVIIHYGYMSADDFAKVAYGLILNPKVVLSPPVNNKGNRIWMVTTSDDNVINKSNYLVEEESYYTLKEPINKNNFIGWYNMTDGKLYNPGDNVQIHIGTYFMAKYK